MCRLTTVGKDGQQAYWIQDLFFFSSFMFNTLVCLVAGGWLVAFECWAGQVLLVSVSLVPPADYTLNPTHQNRHTAVLESRSVICFQRIRFHWKLEFNRFVQFFPLCVSPPLPPFLWGFVAGYCVCVYMCVCEGECLRAHTDWGGLSGWEGMAQGLGVERGGCGQGGWINNQIQGVWGPGCLGTLYAALVWSPCLYGELGEFPPPRPAPLPSSPHPLMSACFCSLHNLIWFLKS